MKIAWVQTKKGYDKILPQHGMVVKETESDVYLLFADGRCKISREEFNDFYTAV
ncbi:hypothetical protein [Aneurinibacillus sp. UBA3580]|jgi:hypothetical protein|uniref:hypothetical protein n=1 Tax=Aneurinibacillus sp. UBA3580 TaxID=1946041 RepID=UPI00257D49D2|nr:hypothetical protein [Aneurinibacillus sp. UBA3580]